MLCRHFSESSLKPANSSQKVYKDECVYCLEIAQKVCLHCYQGFCLSHQHLHYDKTASLHSCFVDIQRVQFKTEQDSPPKIVKLEVKPLSEPIYSYSYQLECLSCKILFPDEDENPLVSSVHDHLTAQRAFEVQAWEEGERQKCEHLQNLVQVALPQIAGHKCSACDLNSNLWLCLVCGGIGCGRRQFDGSGGNGHGALHYERTKHCASVKLGTITPEGDADVYCYECDEMRRDPHLREHLMVFGMNIEETSKTEATVSELQLEQNLKFDFALADADGKRFPDAKLTGMVNSGNFCYISSVCQLLIRSHSICPSPEHFEQCSHNPVTCILCQTNKLINGLLLDHLVPRSISAWMFKAAVAGSHPEFSTARQNDAAEFCQYYLEQLQRKNPALIRSLEFIIKEGPAQYSSLILQLSVDEKLDSGKVDLRDLLDRHFSENVALLSPSLFLVVAINRIVVRNWVPQKLNVVLHCPLVVDIAPYLNKSKDKEGSANEQFPWTASLETLQSMGFDGSICEAALIDSKGDMESAMNAILEGKYTNLEILLQASFPLASAHQALQRSSNDVEKAMDFLLSSNSQIDDKADDEHSESISTIYEMVGFVSHRGPSMHCGHYVSHVKVLPTEGGKPQWILFNDEKTVIVPEESLDTSQAYLVLYKRR